MLSSTKENGGKKNPKSVTILDAEALGGFPAQAGDARERCETSMGTCCCGLRRFHFLKAEAESSSSILATNRRLQRRLWLVQTLLHLHRKSLCNLLVQNGREAQQEASCGATTNPWNGLKVNAQHPQLMLHDKTGLLCSVDLGFWV